MSVTNKNPEKKTPRRAAVYVDELQPRSGRRKELIAILRAVARGKEHFDELIVFGSRKSDVNGEIRDAIALVTEHGAKVTFNN